MRPSRCPGADIAASKAVLYFDTGCFLFEAIFVRISS